LNRDVNEKPSYGFRIKRKEAIDGIIGSTRSDLKLNPLEKKEQCF
jgi:hypothetical protein